MFDVTVIVRTGLIVIAQTVLGESRTIGREVTIADRTPNFVLTGDVIGRV
jgi:hypothetical protein